jgi:hypothetical protein
MTRSVPMTPRTLRPSHDRLVLVAPFGVLFRDAFDGRVVAGPLRVELRRAATGAWQRLQPNGHGVFAAHALPRMRVPVDASPATVPFELRVSDPAARYLPVQLELDLPTDGLYDPGLDAGSPPPREPAVPLYSAPTRGFGGGVGVVRASLRRGSDPEAAVSWARVELWLGSQLLGEGVADREGSLLLPCVLPPPREPPLHGSPPAPAAGFERLRWDVTLRAHWSPELAGRERPDLHAVRRQPEVPLLREPASPAAPLGPQVLRSGVPLVARGDGSSYLFVGA